jgi:ubiquinone biosynthesis protein UbiJ
MKFESPFAAALNHLLEAESWARERLAPFSGETVELRAPPLPALRFAIAVDGRLAPAQPGAAAALVISAGPDALAAAIAGQMRGEGQLLRGVEVSGNAKLAGEVIFLVRHLRWDAEEEAARLIGDVAAHRLARFARGVAAWHADAAQRLAGSLVEYATEEKQLLVRRNELDEFAAAQARLRDGLERLEKRIARLGG